MRPGWVALAMLCLGACEDSASGGLGELELLAAYELDRIDAPSGLAFDGEQSLYVVSDKRAKVFRLTLFGVRADTLDVGRPGEVGYEGVAVRGDELWVAREDTGVVIRADRQTGEVRDRVELQGAVDGNNGLEGLLARERDMLALKEKDPIQLIRFAADGAELGRVDLALEGDLSGLAALRRSGCPDQLLAVSQEARRVYQIDDSGRCLAQWRVAASRPEGIAHDGRGQLYIVDEQTEQLLIFGFEASCR